MDAAARLTAAQTHALPGVTTSLDHAYFYPGGRDRLLDVEIAAVSEAGLRQHAVRGCVARLEGDIEAMILAMPGGRDIATSEEPDAIMTACERHAGRTP